MNKRLIAIGDIHGCFDSFQKLVEKEIVLNPDDKLILLGDYIDRGNQSRKVVDYIIELQIKGFDIIPLLGNHESMLLDTIDDYRFSVNWFLNGGEITLESFGIRSLKELDKQYIDFFRSLQLYFSVDQFLFVHAGFNDEIENPFGDKSQMIWARREEYTNPVLKDRIIIHGHTPIPVSLCKQLIQENSRVINIDTGCVYSHKEGYGQLSAVELYSMTLFSV